MDVPSRPTLGGDCIPTPSRSPLRRQGNRTRRIPCLEPRSGYGSSLEPRSPWAGRGTLALPDAPRGASTAGAPTPAGKRSRLSSVPDRCERDLRYGVGSEGRGCRRVRRPERRVAAMRRSRTAPGARARPGPASGVRIYSASASSEADTRRRSDSVPATSAWQLGCIVGRPCGRARKYHFGTGEGATDPSSLACRAMRFRSKVTPWLRRDAEQSGRKRSPKHLAKPSAR